MSQTFNQLVEKIRADIKVQILNHVRQFDVNYWVDFVNNNATTFDWCSPFRKIRASVSDYVDPKGRFIQFTGEHDYGVSIFPYNEREFFDQIVDLLFAKYF